MGFDPMTHQPRTDLLASLPHLMALLDLKDLMNHRLLDDHSMRLQAEAVQLTKLQYLQYLLQSENSIASNSYGQNGIADVEILNLLNQIPAIKETPFLNSSQFENPASSYFFGLATSQPLHYSNQLPQMSDPQVLFNNQPSLNSEIGQAATLTTMVSQGDNNNNIDPSDSLWVLPSPTSSIPPTLPETSMSNPGDAFSAASSSGGGTYSHWPEIFLDDDSIMHEIS